jgi:RNA polymerase sigma-70 factor (ECF subfamily)
MNKVNINDKIQKLAISVKDNSPTRDRDFNELCLLLIPKLEYFIWKYVKDEDTINDLVNSTFEKVIRKIDTFKPEYRFTTWIYRIATNTALEYINKDKRKNEI